LEPLAPDQEKHNYDNQNGAKTAQRPARFVAHDCRFTLGVERSSVALRIVACFNENSKLGPLGEFQPGADGSLLTRDPVPLPSNWLAIVQEPQSEVEVEANRSSIARGRPYGSPLWQKRAAREARVRIHARSPRPRESPRKSRMSPRLFGTRFAP
jgi:hypothetical protein